MPKIKKTILVVEDEEPLQRAIKSKLEQNNFKVLISSEVGDAIGLLKKSDGRVSAVWLDHYLLGSKSGIDFFSEIKRNELWKKIPVFWFPILLAITSLRRISKWVFINTTPNTKLAWMRLPRISKVL